MIRQSLRWLLLWLSLLALVPAALACNAAVQHDDCCPTGQHMPCAPQGGSAPSTPLTLPACCIAIPAPLTGVSAVTLRPRAESPLPGSLDPALQPQLRAMALLSPTADLATPLPAWRTTPGSQALYLLTRRLRL